MENNVRDQRIPSVAATRIGLLIGVPIAVVFGIHAVSWAAVTLKTWNSGDTLTAADLNANFGSVNAQLDAVNAQITALQGTPWTAASLGTGWSNVNTATYFS